MKIKSTKIAQIVGTLALSLGMSHSALAVNVMRVPIKGLQATPAPDAVLSASALTFGSVTVGTSSAAQSVILQNSGNAVLDITGLSNLTEPFALSNNSCGSVLNPATSCTFQFTYTPTTSTPNSEIFSVTTNTGVQTISLSGSGVLGVPSASPGSVSFGGVAVNTAATAQTLTFSNTGNGPFSITAAPSVSTPFSISSNTCTGILAAGGSCSMQVGFNPGSISSFSESLTIPTSVGSVGVNVSGTGLGASPSISPTSLSFGNVAVGATSSAQTVNFSNAGNIALTITSAPSVVAPFEVLNNTCSGSVAGGASCSFQVAFAPTSAAAASSSVSVGTSAGTKSISLSGTGTQGTPALSTASLSFGNVNVGSTSSAQSVTLSNTGNGSLTLGSITASAPFKISSNTCSSTLAASGSCNIQLEYVPTAAGASSGSLSIPTNVSTKTVSLSGTGISLTPGASVSPTSINEGQDGVSEGWSVTLPGVTVQSTGTGPLTINSISLSYYDANQASTGSSASVSGCTNGQVIQPGQSCTAYISVNVGNDDNSVNYSGTLTINTNAGTWSIPFSGSALD